MNFPESLEQHRQTFLEALKILRYAPSTLEHRRWWLNDFFGYLVEIGVADVREVTRTHIQEYQSRFMSRCCVTTVQSCLSTLRHFFKHLEKTDTILVSPCAGLVLPKRADRLPKNILTPAEVRSILDAPNTQTPQGIRDKAILEMFYSTGLRLEEMSRLTLYDVDYRNGFVRVNKGKFGKDRVVPMGRKASDYVREYLEKVRSEWSKSNREERALWLSCRQPHRALKKQLIGVMARTYAKAAGLSRRVSPHVWRHTCATHMLNGGSNVAYVQRLLGHRSLATTQIYTRVAVADVRKTFRKAHPRS
jgi:integrase/recombinase XerD